MCVNRLLHVRSVQQIETEEIINYTTRQETGQRLLENARISLLEPFTRNSQDQYTKSLIIMTRMQSNLRRRISFTAQPRWT